MRNSVCWPLLVIVMGYGVAVAQPPFGDDRFRNPYPDAGTGAEAMDYRWRPLEQEDPGGQPQSPPAREGYGHPQGSGYTDEPFGLPRGTFRRIEERHTITPHHEKGFRFRPIDPDEQERVKERNANDRQSYPRNPVMRGNGETYPADRIPSPPKFRPDKRLDKGARGPDSRYSYPEGRQRPQFRPY
jgi:hypothetical protein